MSIESDLQAALEANALLIAENRRLKEDKKLLSISLQMILNACRAGISCDWTGGIRCPNPSTDGPTFAHAEKILAKHGGQS